MFRRESPDVAAATSSRKRRSAPGGGGSGGMAGRSVSIAVVVIKGHLLGCEERGMREELYA
jgi:hypothetical protein